MTAPGPDTLLIDGYDIRSAFAGVSVVGQLNLFAPGARRGSDDVVPGRTGQLPNPQLRLDAYEFQVTVQITGANRGERNARLHSLASVLNGTAQDGLVTLTRHLANSTNDGVDVYTANGRFVHGLSMQLFNPFMGRCDLVFLNLDGGWRNSGGTLVWP